MRTEVRRNRVCGCNFSIEKLKTYRGVVTKETVELDDQGRVTSSSSTAGDWRPATKEEALAGAQADLTAAFKMLKRADSHSPERDVVWTAIRLLGYEIYSLTQSTDVMLDMLEKAEGLGFLGAAWDEIGGWYA